MMGSEDKDGGPLAARTRPGRWADRLAGVGFAILMLDAASSAIVGGVAALVGGPLEWAGEGFGGGYVFPALGYIAVFLLGIPSLLYALRHREVLRVLPAAGPFAILVGFAVVAHATDPCFTGWLDAGSKLGSTPLCERFDNEFNIHTRFHLLYHALYPTLILAGLYWLCLRAWQPAVLRFGGPRLAEQGAI